VLSHPYHRLLSHIIVGVLREEDCSSIFGVNSAAPSHVTKPINWYPKTVSILSVHIIAGLTLTPGPAEANPKKDDKPSPHYTPKKICDILPGG